MSPIYRVASSQITSEIIDGEVMIINLKNGNYFNLNGSVVEIWTALQEGASRDRVLSRLSRRYAADKAALATSLDGLLKELQQEELIAPAEGNEPVEAPSAAADSLPTTPFNPPQLSKFSDMQELLLLDPIHDVDDAGWPKAKAN